MLGHLFDADEFKPAVFQNPVDGSIGAAQPDRPLTAALAQERLIYRRYTFWVNCANQISPPSIPTTSHSLDK